MNWVFEWLARLLIAASLEQSAADFDSNRRVSPLGASASAIALQLASSASSMLELAID